MTTPRRGESDIAGGKMSLSPTSCKLFLGRPTRRFALKIPDPRPRRLELFATPRNRHRQEPPGGAAACGARKAFFPLDIDPTRRRFATTRRPSQPAAFTRTGLSAVTLEPLRPRAAHVVQLRSIAAVRQGGADGPDNGPEKHPLFPPLFFPRLFFAPHSANTWNLCGDNVK